MTDEHETMVRAILRSGAVADVIEERAERLVDIDLYGLDADGNIQYPERPPSEPTPPAVRALTTSPAGQTTEGFDG